MAEQLTAALGLELSGFTAGLQQANAQMQAFTTAASNAIQALNATIQRLTSTFQAATTGMQAQNQATQQASQTMTQYNQTLNTYNQTANTTANTTNNIVNVFNNVNQAAQGATAGMSGFVRQMLAVAGGLGVATTLRAIAREFKDFVTDTVTGFASFQEGILKTGTQISGFTAGAAFERMAAQVHDLAIRFGRDTADINKAFFELQGTFGDTAKALQVLEASGQLAVGGFLSIFDASQAISSVLKSMNLDVTESGKVANALKIGADQGRASVGEFARSISGVTPTLSAFRVDLREANAALAVLTNQGYSTSEAVTALSRILFAIGAPTVRAKKYMDELAVTMGVAKIEFVRNEEGVVDLLATLQQFTSISPDLFRRIFGGSEVITKGIIGLTDHVGELREKIDEAVAGGENLKQSQELAGNSIKQVWNQAKQSIDAFYDAIGAVIAQNPAFIAMVNTIKLSFMDVTHAISENKAELSTLITVFAKLSDVAIGVLTGIAQAATFLAGAVGAAVQKIMGGINAVLAAAQAVKGFIGSIPGFSGSSGGAQLGGAGAAYLGENPAGPVSGDLRRRLYGGNLPDWFLNLPAGSGVDAGAIVSPAKAAARFTLGNVDPSGGGGRSRSVVDQAARERERLEEKMRDKLIELDNDEFDAAQKFLEQEVAEARKAGADKLLIEKYYAEQSAKIASARNLAELEETIKSLGEAQKAREDDLKTQQAIADVLRETQAKTTKSQLDDIRAAFAKRREAFEKQNATEEQFMMLAAHEQETLQRTATEELTKELDKQRQAYQKLSDDIAKPLASIFEGVLSHTGNLLDTLKQMFIRFLAELAALAIAQKVIIPIILSVFGGSGSAGSSTGGGTLTGLFSVVGAAGGAGGTAAASGDTSSTLASLGYAQQGLSGASAVSGALGGPTTTSLIGGLFKGTGVSGIASSVGAIPLVTVGGESATALSGAGSFAGADALAGAGGAGTTITLGAAASGLASGLAISLVINELNKLVGLSGGGIKGAAGGALAGAAGGAVAGSIIYPGIGTLIGAIGGAVLGGVFGGLFGGGGDASFQVKNAQAGQASFDPLTGLQLTTPFQALSTSRKNFNPTGGIFPFIDQLNRTVNDMFQAVITGFSSVAPQIQAGLVAPLNAIFAQITDQILHKTFEGGDIGADLTAFFNTELPKAIVDQLDPVIASFKKAVEQISPVVNAFNNIIKQANDDIVALSQKAAQQHLSLQQTIVGIQQGLFSPAQQFVAAQQQFRQGIALLAQATPSQQIALIPELQQLAQTVFALGKNTEVLGQDPQAVRTLQTDLVTALQGVQGTSTGAFGSITNTITAQQDLAQQQIEALIASLSNPAGVPDAIQSALVTLQEIQSALAPFSSVSQADALNQVQTALLTGQVASLQSIDATEKEALAALQSIANSLIAAPGHAAGIAYVPYTGIALLHQGERVVTAQENASGGGGDVIIQINGTGHTSEALVDKIIARIEQKGGRLQGSKIMVRN